MGQRKTLQGLTIADLKKHPSLIPLFVIVGAGGLMAAMYTWRLAVKNPDVSWNPKGNSEPWERYANKQYKFITIDGFEPSKAPKY